MLRSFVAPLLALCLLAACASLGITNTAGFSEEEKSCRPDITNCMDCCGSGGRAACDVLSVLIAEENAAVMEWKNSHGHEPLNAAQLSVLGRDIARLCEYGVERACTAKHRISARLMALTAAAHPPVPERDPPPQPKTERERAREIVKRAEVATKLAWAAVKEEGSDSEGEIAHIVVNCRLDDEQCARYADQGNHVGGLAGLAVTFARKGTQFEEPSWVIRQEVNVAKAEDYARQAKTEADKIVQARNEQLQAMRAEADTMRAAKATCEASAIDCKQRCGKGEQPYCVRIAARLLDESPPRFTEAITLLTKACDSQLQTGCVGLADTKSRERKFDANATNAFASVIFSVDDVAKMRFKLRFGRKTFTPSKANLRGLARMEVDAERKVREDHCPARKAFIEQYGKDEFAKRAKDHCENSPPTEGGVGGGDEPLTADCKAVFATVCALEVRR